MFGNESFRENQREIINATKSGKNVIALIPTGGGKSLTFQLSAVVEAVGVTVVIMPLISLIQDNLSFVEQIGIPACSLSSANKKGKNDKKDDKEDKDDGYKEDHTTTNLMKRRSATRATRTNRKIRDTAWLLCT